MIDPPKTAEQQDKSPDTSLIGVYNQGVSDMVFITFSLYLDLEDFYDE